MSNLVAERRLYYACCDHVPAIPIAAPVSGFWPLVSGSMPSDVGCLLLEDTNTSTHRKNLWLCVRSDWCSKSSGAAAPRHRRTGADAKPRCTEPFRRL